MIGEEVIIARDNKPVVKIVPLAPRGKRQLEIEFRHAARVATLPFHHRDPFDRLLAAQALEERCSIVSANPMFRRYGVKRIW